MPRLPRALAFLAAFALPTLASAHEVYVLTPAQIQLGLQTPPFSEIATTLSFFSQFVFWGFVAALAILVVFAISVIRPLERRLDPLLARARRYASTIARVTIGLALLAGAYYGAIFGPELPLVGTFGAAAVAVRATLAIIGVLLVLDLFTEAAALVALALFAFTAYAHGVYMLTYANYFGEIIVLLILGSRRLSGTLAPYSFAFLRVCFGISLLYASVYAKIIHNELALQVASLPLAGHATSLANVFGFDPHFLVLGAAIVEVLLALFFILGIEIRFASIFLLFWLSLSLWYFGEAVCPHVILIGIPIAFMFYGYDAYSLEGRFFKRGGREPVL